MKTEDAWDELIALKNSWNKQGLEPYKAFILLTSMLCRFALANNIPLHELQHTITELLDMLYNELENDNKHEPKTIYS